MFQMLKDNAIESVCGVLIVLFLVKAIPVIVNSYIPLTFGLD